MKKELAGMRRAGMVAVLALCLPGVLGGVEPPDSAYGLLEAIQEAYAHRPSFRAVGQMERLTLRGEAVVQAELLPFDLAFLRRGPAEAPGLLLRVGEPGHERVVWREDGGAWLFRPEDGEAGTVYPAQALAVAIAGALGGLGASPPAGATGAAGEGLQHPLPIVGLLLGTRAPAPEAALRDGPEPCPGSGTACERLTLSWRGGTHTLELWVESGTGEILQLEVRREPAMAGVSNLEALAQEGWNPWGMAALTTVLRARFAIVEPVRSADLLVFHPPAAATLEDAPFTMAAGEAGILAEGPAPEGAAGAGRGVHEGGFGETVEVRLGTVTVRAVAADGTVLRDLKAEDFRVFLGRREVPVRAVDWVDSQNPLGSDLPPEVLEATGITVDPPGKLVVLFVQADMHPSRAEGHLRLFPRLKDFLETLHRDDRVAVVSFDSHLKLQGDFTGDQEAILEAVRNGFRRRDPPRIRAGRYPSLARHFQVDAGKDAATPEAGLRLTAEALIPLHGEKVVVYTGWGLGRYHFGGISMPREYDHALEALAEARATVFVLDITTADFHTLELGLKQVAADTGGEYFRAFRFVGQSVHHLSRSLDGHYIVTFENPPLDRRARLRVQLAPGIQGEVLAPNRTYREP
jgi:hypothetical protein